MKSLFREPFLHFLLLGALLFVGHALWQARVVQDDRTLIISTAELEQQVQALAVELRRQPTAEEIAALRKSYIEEEVLLREALRLGLDRDDTIIRRRLVQKMRYMIEDVGAPPLPDRVVLQTWYEANPDRFRRPETRSFDHIFLSPRDRSETVVQLAADMLATEIGTDWQEKGDSFGMGRSFTSLSKATVERDFGPAFARALFGLPENANWKGPVNSVFGVHLVRVTDIAPESLPAFSDIVPEVETAWRDAAKQRESADALADLIEHYTKVEVGE